MTMLTQIFSGLHFTFCNQKKKKKKQTNKHKKNEDILLMLRKIRGEHFKREHSVKESVWSPKKF